MERSPISDEALEASAERVARVFRRVRGRAPREVVRRVLETLQAVHDAAHGADVPVAERRRLARDLDALEAELQGRSLRPLLYTAGRLGVVRAWDPVRIRETIDDRRVRQHLARYEERVVRAEIRLRWFLERAGVQLAEPAPARPWELPYASFDEYRELVWGRVSPGG